VSAKRPTPIDTRKVEKAQERLKKKTTPKGHWICLECETRYAEVVTGAKFSLYFYRGTCEFCKKKNVNLCDSDGLAVKGTVMLQYMPLTPKTIRYAKEPK
jgi:hypothetical protein